MTDRGPWDVAGAGPALPSYLVGWDPAQLTDFSAIAVLRRLPLPRTEAPDATLGRLLGRKPGRPTLSPPRAAYDVVALHRWQLVPYTEQVRRLVAVVSQIRAGQPVLRTRPGQPQHRPALDVCVDLTGVGRGPWDMFKEADLGGAALVGITITAGDAVSHADDGTYRVAKLEIASRLQVALEGRRLKVAAGLGLADTLAKELRAFRPKKPKLAGEDPYAGADWREAEHDDLCFAVGLPLWWSEWGSGGLGALADDLREAFDWTAAPRSGA